MNPIEFNKYHYTIRIELGLNGKGKFHKEDGEREIPIYGLIPANASDTHHWTAGVPTIQAGTREPTTHPYIKVKVGRIFRNTGSPSKYAVEFSKVDTVISGIKLKIVFRLMQSDLFYHFMVVESLSQAKKYAKRMLRFDIELLWQYEKVQTLNFNPEGDIREFWKALSVWDTIDGCAVISVDVPRKQVVVGNPPAPTHIYHDEGQWYIGPKAPYSRNASLRP